MEGDQESGLSPLRSQLCLVFGSAHFAGNPAGVHQILNACPLASLQRMAKCLAPIDHAFYWRPAQDAEFQLRFFSHHGAIQLCGHALLATAHHVLLQQGLRQLVLETPLYSHQCRREQGRSWVQLPLYCYREHDDRLLAMLCDAVALPVTRMLWFPNNVWLVITDSLTALQRFSIEAFAWQQIPLPGALIISCGLADGNYAFRYFAPWFGKREDSGTGSAHCYLAAYWLRSGQTAEARQCSAAGAAEMRIIRHHDCLWLSGNVQMAGTGTDLASYKVYDQTKRGAP